MEKKAFFLLIVGIGLLLITSPAHTQEMQWLQYHSERDADRILGDMTRKNLRLTSEKPPNVELPDFQSEEPFFTTWSTLMVESGQLWIALDRTTKNGRWDQLYIDSNVTVTSPLSAWAIAEPATFFYYLTAAADAACDDDVKLPFERK